MDILQLKGNGLEYLPSFLTTLAIGLLIGMERERNPTARAGLRTFALVALLGTTTAMLSAQMNSPWLLAVGFMVVGIFIIVSYFGVSSPDGDPGTTTEAALLMCFSLGAMVWFGFSTLAVMLSIATTALLYFKPELHGIAQRLERRDLLSILQFSILTFVILPILPNKGFGPYEALNPNHIWLMVVLISGVSLAGYVALRLVGQRYGAPLLGLMGGLVSSTVTTMIYSRHGKRYESMGQLAVVVILLANLVVPVRLAILGGVVAPGILPRLLPVLGMGLVLGMLVSFITWLRFRKTGDLPIPEIQNPTEIRAALIFGVIFALVLFLSAWLSDRIGSVGLYGVAMVSGLTDVDAITLSSLTLFSLEKLNADQVVTAIVIALNANLLFKFGLILFVGGTTMAKRSILGLLAVGVGSSAALYLM
ncbi:MgtC/SapB family protein [Sulfurirhabdus autotrophica]|uniref:Uncharacterized membrane protein (DUF4010 family) n=1 Tax=Sulfurirhabdus autotrophica TaxID=1706046 RepID=A0A4R3YHQ4_9PROT|nr:MgtC/SapB family protein [Sulfurirhabdus autotrophica]TCV90123.1 uncharacterized membrane protein (DUF4010 family) [Sulfurirhabdus autotrophica]